MIDIDARMDDRELTVSYEAPDVVVLRMQVTQLSPRDHAALDLIAQPNHAVMVERVLRVPRVLHETVLPQIRPRKLEDRSHGVTAIFELRHLPAYEIPYFSSRLRILPVAVIGRASTISTMRGYL